MLTLKLNIIKGQPFRYRMKVEQIERKLLSVIGQVRYVFVGILAVGAKETRGSERPERNRTHAH